MSKYTVIIADDEAPARKKMERLLGKFQEIEIIHIAENGLDALESIRTQKPDIAFLDIEMPGLNGIEVAENLLDVPTYIVFATAYNEHAIKAFELNAIDYLLKPFNEDRLSATIEKILAGPKAELHAAQKEKIEKIGNEDDLRLPFSNKIPIPTFDRYKLVDYDEVVLIEVEDRNTILHTMDKAYTMNQTLDYFEKKLPLDKFLRVNRSSLIGLIHVKEIVIWFGNRFKIVLSNNKEVVSSREKSKVLKNVLKF
ncbi:MAG: response regulator transcription factor [Bacteroidia bacterium]|nr:response regulator transcription factor [Bacteroidia bacterium]